MIDRDSDFREGDGEGPSWPTFDELPVSAEPPDPFTMFDGTTITTPEEWRTLRRPELIALFQHYAYGTVPDAPEVTVTEDLVDDGFYNGSATLKLLTLTYPPEGTPPIHLLLVIPNGSASPVPVFLGLNFFGNHTVMNDPRIPLTDPWVPTRGEGVKDNKATEASRGTSADRWPFEDVIQRGFAVATLYHGDLDPDLDDFTNGVHPHFWKEGQTGRDPYEWGSVAAWAWGLSRAVDALVQEPDVDNKRIAVLGHSRNGKAALLAGALDERIGLVISNQSGCMGAALSRGKTGETLFWITKTYGYWFNASFAAFSEHEDKLPIDQHLLLALIAPRPLLVASATDDAWSDPPKEFESTLLASEVYTFVGEDGLGVTEIPQENELIATVPGYHVRPGDHGIGLQDWTVFMDYAEQVGW